MAIRNGKSQKIEIKCSVSDGLQELARDQPQEQKAKTRPRGHHLAEAGKTYRGLE